MNTAIFESIAAKLTKEALENLQSGEDLSLEGLDLKQAVLLSVASSFCEAFGLQDKFAEFTDRMVDVVNSGEGLTEDLKKEFLELVASVPELLTKDADKLNFVGSLIQHFSAVFKL